MRARRPRCGPESPTAPRVDLDAEHDVLGDGEDGDEHEVLVDHADAGGDRVAGVWKLTGLPSIHRISPSSGWYRP